MKTLDEVIKSLEKCMVDDAIESEGAYFVTDVLHYLKEYQEHLKWHAYEEHCLDNEKRTLQEKKAEFNEVLTDYVALKQWWTEQQENPPLTWDKLKTMEENPVWIEGPLLKEGPHWIILGAVHLYEGKIVGYGKTWKAYRWEKK